MKRVASIAECFASAAQCRLTWSGAALLATIAIFTSMDAVAQSATTKPPRTLDETGLYADFATLQIDPKHLAFSPQYPLWSDGAAKRRWVSLPPGTAIDGSDPDAWIFPAGTRFWKEFSFNGQRVETRYMERLPEGRWLYAVYAWGPDGREAQLVSEKGRRGAYALGGGRSHTIPSVNDCKACHQGGRAEVLGFSALQLSPERDLAALHAEPLSAAGVDLRYLVDKKLLVGFPEALQETPPRIAAASATERVALGYMHGNCGHCHNEHGSLRNIALFLRHVLGVGVQPALTSTVGQPVKKPAPGQSPDAVLRVEPRNPDRSALMQRVSSRYPALQMPPLGTELVDQEAVLLIQRWIAEADELRRETPQDEKGTWP